MISLKGQASQVEDALSRLKYRPGCIYAENLSLVIEIILWS